MISGPLTFFWGWFCVVISAGFSLIHRMKASTTNRNMNKLWAPSLKVQGAKLRHTFCYALSPSFLSWHHSAAPYLLCYLPCSFICTYVPAHRSTMKIRSDSKYRCESNVAVKYYFLGKINLFTTRWYK